MSGHQVLYQKFRPTKFAEVIGQDAVVNSLRKALSTNAVPHAMLFSGQRGTGKTTTARLVAAALNCLEIGEGSEPCGHCRFCSGVLQGQGIVVVEVDCATNRGIDDVRQLKEIISVASPAPFRVIILDEVHQLTGPAVTALLKTVEEPSPNTVLVLATTDFEKVPVPLRSRCVKYTFRTLGAETMSGLARDVAQRSGIDLDTDALASVVAEGRGSARDMLSALELVSTGGLVRAPASVRALALAVEEDSVAAMMAHWRTALLATSAPAVLDIGEVEMKEAVREGEVLGVRRLTSLLRAMADAVGKMHLAGDPRLLLEVTLLAATTPSASTQVSSLHDRLDDVEDALDALRAVPKLVRALAATLETMGAGDPWPPAASGVPALEVERPATEADDQAAADELDVETTLVIRDDDDDDDDDDEWQRDLEPQGRPAPLAELAAAFGASALAPAPVDQVEPEVPALSHVDTRTAQEVLDALHQSASHRLRLRLGSAEALFGDSGNLEIEVAAGISSALVKELKTLVAEQGHQLDLYEIDEETP